MVESVLSDVGAPGLCPPRPLIVALSALLLMGVRGPGVCSGPGAGRPPTSRSPQRPGKGPSLLEGDWRDWLGVATAPGPRGVREWAQCLLGPGGQTVSTSPSVCCSEWGLCRDGGCGFPKGLKVAGLGQAAVQLWGSRSTRPEGEPQDAQNTLVSRSPAGPGWKVAAWRSWGRGRRASWRLLGVTGFSLLNWELTVISALCPQEVCPDIFSFHPFARLTESQLRGISWGGPLRGPGSG